MSVYHKMLSSKRWAATRRTIFARDHYTCRMCGRHGRAECDHVLPISKGGALWALSNLQTLCRTCHIKKTRGEKEPRPRTVNEQKFDALVRDALNATAKEDA